MKKEYVLIGLAVITAATICLVIAMYYGYDLSWVPDTLNRILGMFT